MKKIIKCPYCGTEHNLDLEEIINSKFDIDKDINIHCVNCFTEFITSIKFEVNIHIPIQVDKRLRKEFGNKTVKCPHCRSGQMSYYCGNNIIPFFICSNYGGGCTGTMNVNEARHILSIIDKE